MQSDNTLRNRKFASDFVLNVRNWLLRLTNTWKSFCGDVASRTQTADWRTSFWKWPDSVEDFECCGHQFSSGTGENIGEVHQIFLVVRQYTPNDVLRH